MVLEIVLMFRVMLSEVEVLIQGWGAGDTVLCTAFVSGFLFEVGPCAALLVHGLGFTTLWLRISSLGFN